MTDNCAFKNIFGRESLKQISGKIREETGAWKMQKEAKVYLPDASSFAKFLWHLNAEMTTVKAASIHSLIHYFRLLKIPWETVIYELSCAFHPSIFRSESVSDE